MLSRRHLLQSIAALGLVAATPEPVRRFWALDQTMVPDPDWFTEGGITRISDDDVFEWIDTRGEPVAITFVDGVYIKHPDHPTFNLIL